MYKILFVLLSLTIATNALSYTDEDWKIYKECKALVYENIESELDYKACKEMLEHKKALKKYGASSSYKYWIKRLYDK